VSALREFQPERVGSAWRARHRLSVGKGKELKIVQSCNLGFYELPAGSVNGDRSLPPSAPDKRPPSGRRMILGGEQIGAGRKRQRYNREFKLKAVINRLEEA
jgi:hypothetical protein